LVHLLKYRGEIRLAETFAKLLFESFTGAPPQFVVPVPMHWTRRMWRGYDQAEEIARELSQRFGCPLLGALKRTRRTPALFKLSQKERATVMADAFSCRSKSLQGCRVVLVDDVYTTGITLKECTRVLNNSGAQSVTAVIPALTPRSF
jgi:ComF family protein